VTLCAMLGFLIYTGVIVWTFIEQRMARLTAMMLGAIVFSYGFSKYLMAIEP
jgi:hypothetical protein